MCVYEREWFGLIMCISSPHFNDRVWREKSFMTSFGFMLSLKLGGGPKITGSGNPIMLGPTGLILPSRWEERRKKRNDQCCTNTILIPQYTQTSPWRLKIKGFLACSKTQFTLGLPYSDFCSASLLPRAPKQIQKLNYFSSTRKLQQYF